MRETATKKQALCGARGECFEVTYSLLEEELEVGNFHYISYGLRVEKSDGESETIRDITTSRTRIETLYQLLVRNGVTPMQLREVLEDWL